MSSAWRIRWDRLGRFALVGVLCALVYLAASAAVTLVSTWHEAQRNNAQIVQLERQNRLLRAEHAAFASKSTLVAEARRLGMSRPGELQYIVRGLPGD